MTSSHVQIAPDGSGKDVETVALTSDEAGTPTTQRQVVALGDATTFANKAHVDDSGNLAVVVSNLPSTQPVSGTVAVSSLPGSPAQDGTDATGVTAPTGGVGIRGWLSGIYQRLGGTLATSRTWTLGSGTDSVNIGNFPGTQPISGSVSVSNFPATQPISGTVAVSGTVATTLSGTPAVSVSNFPATQPVSGTVTANAGSGTLATSVADGSDAALGATGDLATANTLIGRVKQLLTRIPTALGQQTSAASLSVVVASDQTAIPVSGTVTASVSNFPATQPVSGTVTANAGSGTFTISGAVTNSNLDVALSTRLKPADTLTAVTTVGAVTAITNALPTGTNSIGAVTNANLDVALSTRLKPADTLTGVTTVAAVTAITNALPAGTNTIGAVKQATQSSLTATLCTNVTSTTPSTGQSLDGYDGAATVELVAVGTVSAQAVTLQIEGSLDNANWYIIGSAQIDATANPSYAAAGFTLTPGNGTIRHLYALRDTVKFMRVNPTANNLGTGLSASLYTNPV